MVNRSHLNLAKPEEALDLRQALLSVCLDRPVLVAREAWAVPEVRMQPAGLAGPVELVVLVVQEAFRAAAVACMVLMEVMAPTATTQQMAAMVGTVETEAMEEAVDLVKMGALVATAVTAEMGATVEVKLRFQATVRCPHSLPKSRNHQSRLEAEAEASQWSLNRHRLRNLLFKLEVRVFQLCLSPLKIHNPRSRLEEETKVYR